MGWRVFSLPRAVVKCAGAVSIICTSLLVLVSYAQADQAANCTGLTKLSSATLKITDAHVMPAGEFKIPGPIPFPPAALPDHCIVQGVLNPRTGVDGKAYGIKFEMRLPKDWNGDFMFQGGGGLDGAVMPAIGNVASDDKTALARGFAVISSDGGHEGMDASFAADQQSKLDFAYAQIGSIAELGKAIVASYYGSAAKFSYFVGCSNGGREAMIAAERYPLAFDGIVAGDPGFNLSSAAISQLWRLRQFLKVAPKDASGKPILSGALTNDDLKLVSDAVLAACDDLDGLKDEIVSNLAACHFSLKTVVCKAKQKAACLTPAKAVALQNAMDGPTGNGRALYSAYPYDTGMSDFGWRLWTLGTSPTAVPNALDALIGTMAVGQYFMTPANPGVSATSFDFDHDPEKVQETAALNDATSTNMSTFIGHGGKFIIFHGNSDPVFSVNASIGWYEKVSARYPQTDSWARLYRVPGMTHCMGGPSTDQFDAIAAIQHWREDQRAPDQIPAHGHTFPNVVRPLCPYPKYAHYNAGDPAKITSFVCQ